MSEREAVTRSVVPEPAMAAKLWRAAQVLLASAIVSAPVVAVLALPALRDQHVGILPLAHGLAALAAICAAGSMVMRRRKPRWSSESSATASEAGLTLGGALVPRTELLEATITPRGTGLRAWLAGLFGRPMWVTMPADEVFEVELRRPGWWSHPVRFVARTLDDARAMVAALGLDVTRRAITRKVRSRALQPRVAFATVAVFLLSILGGLALAYATRSPLGFIVTALGFALITALQVLAFVKTKLTIGVDGVSSSWLGRATTVPLPEITSLEIVPRGRITPARVLVHRRNGEPLDIAIGTRGNTPLEPYIVEDECNRIVERIRDAMAAQTAPPPTEYRAWCERRHGLSADAWIATLKGVGDSYRDGHTVPFTTAELWDVVKNTRATELERISATVAIASQPDAATRERFADAARATALPRVKLALQAAANGDDAALARVVTQAFDGEPRRAVPQVRVEIPTDAAAAPSEDAHVTDAPARAHDDRR